MTQRQQQKVKRYRHYVMLANTVLDDVVKGVESARKKLAATDEVLAKIEKVSR